MRHFTTALALAGACLAHPATGQEAMTEAERDAFRAEVRAYLLENPEVIMEAIDVLEERQAVAAEMRDQELVATYAEALFNAPSSFVGGNPDGDITVVEFLDYRCGYCKRAHPEIAALIENDPNVRLVIKEFPILGEESLLASRYALAVKQVAGDDAYYDVHNTLMDYQGAFTEDGFGKISDAFGLDHVEIVDAMTSEAVTNIIFENRVLGQNLSISGTPSFVFADQMVRGYIPLAQMEAFVAKARSQDG